MNSRTLLAVMGSRFTHLLPVACLVVLASCGSAPAHRPPLTQNRELDSYVRAAAFPGAEPVVVLAAMQQFQATHREWEGYELFGRLAREQPARAPFFASIQAVMQARVANDVPLLRRVAWVDDAIAKLDAGVVADPVRGRLGRGLVFAALPPRFDKSRQAIEDLEACLAHRDAMPLDIDRGVYRALGDAYAQAGDLARAREMRERAGVESERDPAILTNVSVGPDSGFRFSEKRFVDEGGGVYVAEGYDFANLAFIVTPAFVVAIDAGTTMQTAADAVHELRNVTQAPIKYVILTHGHWDHVGGLAAVREPGSIVIAQAGFPAELARSKANRPAVSYFFGTAPNPLDAHPDRFVASPETLVDGDLDLELVPVHGGETDDGLFIRDRKHDLLFVGDAFMPYLGSPFVAEGSPQGYLDSLATVIDAHPRKVIHGHPPLTRLFTIEAMPGLRAALTELEEHTLRAAQDSKPLPELLHEELLPDSLRSAPTAVMPYLTVRDTFIQRTYLKEAGYWRSNGDGVDEVTRGEWAAALDLVGGGTDAPFVRAVDDLAARGDAPMALRVVDAGLLRYPESAPLRDRRDRVLDDLRARYSATNPFRFIVYSQMEGRALLPVKP